MTLGCRVLPPVGATIPHGAVLGSLSDSLFTALGVAASSSGLPRVMRERTGISQWVLTNSGRSALAACLMSLRAMNPGRDEVVVPAYTSFSVPAAVVRAGLRVSLCDIEDETLGLSPKQLEQVLSPRTLCVIANHLYGVPCRIKAACEVAREHVIPVIEDAAQAMGLRCEGRPGGSWGDAAIFTKCLPIFQAMGKNIVHMGGTGAGQVTKLANQIVGALILGGIGEALVLGRKAGVEPIKMVEAIGGGAARNWLLEIKGPRIIERNFEPGFFVDLQHKDLSNCLQAGRDYNVPLPLTALVTQMYTRLLAQGKGKLDNSAVVQVSEELASQEIRPLDS